MNFKEKLLNHKKMLIAGGVLFLLGSCMSYSTMQSTEEYNKLISQKTEVATQLGTVEKEKVTKQEELTTITEEKEKLEEELQGIKTEKAEIVANEKAAEEKRLEDERIAAEEKVKRDKEQEIIVSNNNNNSDTGNISNGNSSSGNAGGSSSGGSSSGGTTAPSVDTTTPVGAMVWKTGSGTKYHSHNNCGNSQNVTQVSLSSAQGQGLTPCKTCY